MLTVPEVTDTMNSKQKNIYIDFNGPHYNTAYFFLICACFRFVQPVVVLVLVPDSSREASFFLSFPSAAGTLPSLRERCWRLLWPLKLSTEVKVSSPVCRWSSVSLINDSFLSQTSTVTPASEQEAASVTESDLRIIRLCFQTTHPFQSQSHHPFDWTYWSVNKYLYCVNNYSLHGLNRVFSSVFFFFNILTDLIPEAEGSCSWHTSSAVLESKMSTVLWSPGQTRSSG